MSVQSGREKGSQMLIQCDKCYTGRINGVWPWELKCEVTNQTTQPVLPEWGQLNGVLSEEV